jgi:thiol-disulfide isomerase/thioredoxin
MVYLEINKSNYKNKDSTTGKNKVEILDDYMGNKKNKVFILFYMEGCGPCNATRPEWSKIENVLSKDFLNRDDIIIVSMDHELANDLKNLSNQPSSFPTIRFMTNGGKTVENYEDSKIENKDRTIDSFIEWIKTKTGEYEITRDSSKGGNSNRSKRSRMTRRKSRSKRGGKWSLKYKRSINCKNPKGFSQKQHCKYGRKK